VAGSGLQRSAKGARELPDLTLVGARVVLTPASSAALVRPQCPCGFPWVAWPRFTPCDARRAQALWAAGMGARQSRDFGHHGPAETAPRNSSSATPQIRCYTCSGIFMATQRVDHIRCPFCSTINGVPNAGGGGGGGGGGPLAPPQQRGAAAAARALTATGGGELSAAATQRQEQLLRRLQQREITPLELLILREFVEHLQQNRAGASSREIDQYTAQWTVDDVSKLPEELRSCCVCLEDVSTCPPRFQPQHTPRARRTLGGRMIWPRATPKRAPPLMPPPHRSPLHAGRSCPPAQVCVGNCVRTLPCLHTFHAGCAEEWLQKKKVHSRHTPHTHAPHTHATAGARLVALRLGGVREVCEALTR
jgi:hypothetical protein